MAVAVALLVGTLVATGFALLLGRSILRQIIGLALLSHAANVVILMAAGLRGGVPVIGVTRGPLTVRAFHREEPFDIEATPRIGIRQARHRLLRFTIRGSPFLSRRPVLTSK